MFVDIVKISAAGGKGGDGAVAFHREKYIAAGGPDGGNGGRGGDIVFVADEGLSTLLDFRYKRKYRAENGDNGGTKRCAGRAAQPLVVRVPRGTLVRDTDTGRLIADVSGTEPVVIAKGGRGGKGNACFATPTRQLPRFAKPGLPGEALNLTLELKLLADVGIVGFPNVGKSSLIAAVSAAKPEIADYHFTTITPVLGVVRSGDTSFVMADIPGLIEGANEGAGLGKHFLRHIERCRLLIHVIDASGHEGRDPIHDFDVITNELSSHSPELAALPVIVAANKIDITEPERLAELAAFIKEKNLPYFEISAATTAGTTALVDFAAAELAKLPPIKHFEAEAYATDLPIQPSYTVSKLADDVFDIAAPFLERILDGANMNDYESLQYFQRVLQNSGVNAELVAQGVKDGDTVSVGDYEFEYIS
ncbi:MAG: GTPase ObgE [Oscillospiraceae bacterium]|jgi:GTP-binding protein|nr:GTPase ObgE [Oscillospiraceae bacterium]